MSAPWLWPAVVAAIIRVPVAAIADDQWGDAPIRLDLLQRWTAAPGLWWSFHRVYQYGPFPTHLAGVLALSGLGAELASRVLVVASGVTAVALVAILANRIGGPRAALAAGLAAALSPIHIQASTTYASEAPYLAFALGIIWACWERRPWLCAALAFAASTTRYDAWLWLPVLGLWWLLVAFPDNRRRGLLAASLLAIGPLSLLIANGLDGGHPFAAIDYINMDHEALAKRSQDYWGKWPWRLWMLGYWPAALLGVLTPGFGMAAISGAWKALRTRSQAALPAVLGALPPVTYAFKTTVLGSFWPMARFALGPITFFSIAMPPLRARTLAACIAVAVLSNAVVMVLGDGTPGLGNLAAAMSPVSRLPSDLIAGAAALRAVPGPVALDESPYYEDVLIAYKARMNRYKLLHPEPGTAPRRIVSIVGGGWDKELKATGHVLGHAYRRAGEDTRVVWWDLDEAPAR